LEDAETQVAVVGAGAGGMYTALCAARDGARVALVSATPLAESSSYWAQGGLAAALTQDDSPDLHMADTVRAGRGAVRESAARAASGPSASAGKAARSSARRVAAHGASAHGS